MADHLRGQPDRIDISVIEIDANDAQVVALLDTLATISGQAFPPAAPVLPVLNALGKACSTATPMTPRCASADADPGAGYAGVSHPTVEAGDYVFVREEDRTVATPWHELEVDTNTGLLYRGDGPFVENSYLTSRSTRTSARPTSTWPKHLRQLPRRARQGRRRARRELQPLLTELEKLGFARVQTRQFDEARDLLTEWKNAQQEGEEGRPSARPQALRAYAAGDPGP